MSPALIGFLMVMTENIFRGCYSFDSTNIAFYFSGRFYVGTRDCDSSWYQASLDTSDLVESFVLIAGIEIHLETK